MKVKINESGNLEIERAGEFKRQKCFERSTESRSVFCGDWCPHFGEPKAYTHESKDKNTGQTVYTHSFNLDICQSKILMLDEAVIDERGKG